MAKKIQKLFSAEETLEGIQRKCDILKHWITSGESTKQD